MSLDICLVFFSTVDPSLTPAKVRHKVAKVFQKSNSIESVSCSKVIGGDRDMCIEIHADSSDLFDDALNELLKTLSNLPKENEPYIEMVRPGLIGD